MKWLLHHSTSSPCTICSGGHLLLNKAALPLIKQIDNLWKSLEVVVVSSSPVCLARALPSFLTSAMAEGCQAPRLSTARGRKTMPCRWQASQDLSSFLWWATERAWPGVMAASLTTESWSGLMTVTSIATSLPLAQPGISTSAGLPPSPGSRKRPSLAGARAAEAAVECRVSLRALCLAILSPCQAQFMACTPILSLA